MTTPTKNPAAVALGKLGRGVPRNFSRAERRRRAQWAREMTRRRLATAAAVRSRLPHAALS